MAATKLHSSGSGNIDITNDELEGNAEQKERERTEEEIKRKRKRKGGKVGQKNKKSMKYITS
jgi:hypothetical protein